ncbi:MAG: hypothetical protein HY860_04575 [Chlamydiales bacterium]|nr:hypothetical protein [Chlamydiales bacterium]
MKKLVYGAIFSLTCASLSALPVGNPSESSLMKEGVCWQKGDDGVRHPWLDHFSIRAGYYGDFEFNRHTKVSQDVSHQHMNRTSIYTNAGYLAFNFYDCVDLFTTLGVSKIYMQGDAAVFGSGAAGQWLDMETNSDFSWSVGARATLFQYAGMSIGLEGQYFATSPDLSRITQAAAFTTYHSFDLSYSDWQVGLGVSYKIDAVIPTIPYLAIKWSQVNIDMDNFNLAKALPNTLFDLTLYNLNSQRHLGYAAGVSFLDSEEISVTVEASFIDSKALYANFQLRF